MLGAPARGAAYTRVLKDAAFSSVVATRDVLAAVAGDRLFLTPIANPSQQSVFTVATGEDIVALSTSGGSLIASTTGGRVVRVEIDKLPIVDPALVRRSTILSGLSEPVRNMVSDGDALYFADGSVLSRLDLTTLTRDNLVSSAGTIDALAVSAGSLWAGVGNDVYQVGAGAPWPAALPTKTLTTPHAVRTLVAQADRLLVGSGEFGLGLYDLSDAALVSSAALYEPAASRTFSQADSIPLSLADAEGVNVARFKINDETVATLRSPPFAASVRVPGFLNNGQAFQVTAEVEDVFGRVQRAYREGSFCRARGSPRTRCSR